MQQHYEALLFSGELSDTDIAEAVLGELERQTSGNPYGVRVRRRLCQCSAPPPAAALLPQHSLPLVIFPFVSGFHCRRRA